MTRAALRSRLRAAVLIAGGALALHELRYVVVYGGGSDEALATTGHHYLGLLTPLAVALLVVTLRPGLGLLGRLRPGPSPARVGLRSLWGLSTGCVLAVYAAQEWLEGEMSQGHPSGLAAVVGSGGWSAILLAAAVGALVALALRGAQEAAPISVIAARVRLAAVAAPAVALVSLHARPARDPVACFLASRGPPRASA